jgi:hypothetical protein
MGSSIHKPEEIVRQSFISYLISLGYPHSLMVIEKALSELPHLQSELDLPLRRIDLLVYHNHQGSLKPLVLVECKSEQLDQKALNQALGYNHYIQASYICLVSKEGYMLYNFKSSEWEKTLKTYEKICL